MYAPVDGGVVLVPALRSSARGARKWLPLAKESVGVIAGLVALLWPGKTASGQLNVLVGWAVGTGILKLITAIVLRSEVEETGAACRRRAVDKLGRHPCGLSKLRSAPLAPSFSIPPRPLLLPDGVLRAATVLQPEPDTPEHGRIRSCLETLKTAYISQIVVRDRTPMESPELIYKEEVAGWNPSSSISSAPGFVGEARRPGEARGEPSVSPPRALPAPRRQKPLGVRGSYPSYAHGIAACPMLPSRNLAAPPPALRSR